MCNQEELLQKMVGHRKANTKIKKVITSTGTIVLLFRDSEKARFEFLRTWVCFLSGFQKRKLWGTRAQPKFVLSYVHDAFFFILQSPNSNKTLQSLAKSKNPYTWEFLFCLVDKSTSKKSKVSYSVVVKLTFCNSKIYPTQFRGFRDWINLK
jgi:hypothetical protein